MFEWDINLPTAATFCSYYIEFVVNENDFRENRDQYPNFEAMKTEVKSIVWKLLELSLFGKFSQISNQ